MRFLTHLRWEYPRTFIMIDNEIYRYPLAEVLEALGAARGGARDMYHSPLHEDKTASLHVNADANVWFDHGLGIGGTNVQLVMLARRCGSDEAAEFIRGLAARNQDILPAPKEREQKDRIPSSPVIRVEPLTERYLLDYVTGVRRIPAAIAMKYCVGLTVRGKYRNHSVIGFLNNNGGYAMKAPTGYKRTDRAGITTIAADGTRSAVAVSGDVAVFEGFFDFLSWLSDRNRIEPGVDVVVLNSVANVGRARVYLRAHRRVFCYLDRDTAGFECLERIVGLFGGQDGVILDMSTAYDGYNDYSEMWMGRQGAAPGV